MSVRPGNTRESIPQRSTECLAVLEFQGWASHCDPGIVPARDRSSNSTTRSWLAVASSKSCQAIVLEIERNGPKAGRLQRWLQTDRAHKRVREILCRELLSRGGVFQK